MAQVLQSMRLVVIVLVIGVASAGAWMALWAWSRPSRPAAPPARADEATIQRFCGTCHQVPPVDCQPRLVWPRKIQWMYDVIERGRPWPETAIPPKEDVLRYFNLRAPEHLELSREATGSPPSRLAFVQHPIKLGPGPTLPAVANVKFARLDPRGPLELLVCDMRRGTVEACQPARPDVPARTLGKIPHPCHTEVVDLDADGLNDLLVANLGVFMDEDTHDGSVVWLHAQPDGTYRNVTLLSGVGRVADVRTADFDGDGDLDLIVAVYGHFLTGNLIYLENHTTDYGAPHFEPFIVDGRTGAIHVPVIDLNQDGRPDFLALLAQEHELVLAFHNSGRGEFLGQAVYTAPHPNWGSTGIELVDMDGDGDLDILYTNGDVFDNPPVLKPYHGIGWLENTGSLPYKYHRITDLPGVHAAKAVDLDGDGDLDIVACAFMPWLDPAWPEARAIESIVWLEQTAPGTYRRQVIETGSCYHTTLDVADVDGDGDWDIVLGNFYMPPRDPDLAEPSLLWLENPLR